MISMYHCWKRRVLIHLLLAALIAHHNAAEGSLRPHQQRSAHQQRRGTAGSGRCPDPGTPRHGYSYRQGPGSRFRIGTRVSYGCNAGYLLLGPRELTCRYNWTINGPSWHGGIPQCVYAFGEEILTRFARSRGESI